MTEENKGINLEHIYKNREEFIVIGLTGKIGSGCTHISHLFSKETVDDFPLFTNPPKDNDERKYKIARNFLKEKWKPFYRLDYDKIISLILYSQQLQEMNQFFDELLAEVRSDVGIKDLKNEREAIEFLRNSTDFKELDFDGMTQEDLYTFFENNNDFIQFHQSFTKAISIDRKVNALVILRQIANNQRRGGCYFCAGNTENYEIYSIALLINKIIKGFKKIQKQSDSSCRVIIDCIRNPLELTFFKERYAAFYTLAVNPNESIRRNQLEREDNYRDEIESIIEIESIDNGDKNKRVDFYKQNVQQCLQKADLHLSFMENDSFPYNIEQQIVIFYSLMLHPGLVTPTPLERSMQMAFTAKYNSGCISRQVGAVVTDSSFSVKAIGWNNTAEKQTPCLLRSADDLLNDEDEKAFSTYERDKKNEFNERLREKFGNSNRAHMDGVHCSFCFKDFQNSIKEGKNQVHTRSLHAEENAMLQITKYGGQGIKDGFLFTTASPCELCSKKAYQLGIRKIFYIDPYPGISEKQILESGSLRPQTILFTGAIGKAYHRFYEPFMPLKDEVYIRTGMKVQNRVSALEDENEALKKQLEEIKKMAGQLGEAL